MPVVVFMCSCSGGTFALYSLLRQHINFKSKTLVQSTQLESDLHLLYHSNGSALQSKAKRFLEESIRAQTVITFIVLLGTCMVIGDGALTPAISGATALARAPPPARCYFITHESLIKTQRVCSPHIYLI